MTRTVLLDATPLGVLANPNVTLKTRFASAWLAGLVAAGHRVVVPEIADYEVRRELIRHTRTHSIARLDSLAVTLVYLPLTTAVMRLAADLWADARLVGRPTAPDPALDGDVILAAQMLTLADSTAIIATGNPAHLSRFAPAADWPSIVP